MLIKGSRVEVRFILNKFSHTGHLGSANMIFTQTSTLILVWKQNVFCINNIKSCYQRNHIHVRNHIIINSGNTQATQRNHNHVQSNILVNYCNTQAKWTKHNYIWSLIIVDSGNNRATDFQNHTCANYTTIGAAWRNPMSVFISWNDIENVIF